ncbi:MAG: hypothetical protein JXB32_04535 [Deltaproteobacteria bacterium]|nr:hypothetical protein [Deltaproteobacteria bacterium]
MRPRPGPGNLRDAPAARRPLRRITAALTLAALAGCVPQGTNGPRAADGVAGRLIVTFEDGLSEAFRLVRAEVARDGVPLWNCHDPERSLDVREPILIHDGPVGPGAHRLSVSLEYRGRGHGVFSYLSQYTFRVASAHEFGIPPSGTLALRVASWERGDPNTPLEERPQVRFEEQPFLLWAVQSRTGCPWADDPP